MDYIKIRFSDDINQLDSKIEETIDDMFRSMNPILSFSECIWKPQMDIYETTEEIIVVAEIAGVNKDDLGVEISSKAVRIYGNRAEMPKIENATYRLAEIQYGKFERILFFSVPVDTDKVIATYSNGFLRVKLGKLAAGGTYTIPVTAR
ncbi:MAG: Hsp20/alpha crystallin family protein [Deltaproteobacteria bacterium]|nr:Hsp20/alpha crystallin family protein [Deltaproteobacteria bacterium]MBW2662582.1 Hsp20/alpha crystallin family protein [Deltaproteobacteria bacterium]